MGLTACGEVAEDEPCVVPSLGQAVILPGSADTTTDLTLSWRSGWGDVDPADVSVAWFVEGAEVASGETLPAAQTARGATVFAELTWSGCDTTVARATVPVVVANAAPSVAAVQITPSEVDVTSRLEATATVDDADGDALTTSWTWTVDGVVVQQGGQVLSATERVVRGAEVRVDVVASDGFGAGAFGSASVVVGDAAPEPPVAELVGGDPLERRHHLWCRAASVVTDPDGDVPTTTFAWTRNGVAHGGPVGRVAVDGDTIPGSELVAGDVWSCTISVADATTTVSGTPVEATVRANVFVDVATSVGGACGLRSDGVVVCRGSNTAGQLEMPRTGWSELFGGENAWCAKNPAGEVFCWAFDSNGFEELGGEPTGAVAEVVVKSRCAVARRPSGGVVAWGDQDDRCRPGTAGGWSAIAGTPGTDHICAARAGAGLRCWGSSVPSAVSNALPSTGTYTSVASSARAACALDGSGAIVCFSDVSDTPEDDAPSGTGWEEIVAGTRHLCARDGVGDVTCWGEDDGEQLAVPEGETFVALAAAARHTCGVTSAGRVVCWGDFFFGQLEAPTDAVAFHATALTGGCGVNSVGAWTCDDAGELDLSSLVAGGAFDVFDADFANVCTITGGTLACVHGYDEPALTPPGGSDFVDVAVGTDHACARRVDGTLTCWGDDGSGRASPPSGVFLDVCATGDKSCGVRSDHTAICWGNDGSYRPPPGVMFDRVACGASYICGLTSAGDVRCWGDAEGPYEIPGDYRDLDIGGRVVCATRVDGQVYCHDLRRDEEYTVNPPAGLPFLSVDMTGRDDIACGVRENGERSCWGIRIQD